MIATRLRREAHIAFGTALALAPLRWRIELAARPTPPLYGDYTDFLLGAGDIALAVTLSLWLCSRALVRARLHAGAPIIASPLAVLLGAAALSVPASLDPALSLYHLARLVALGILYLFIVNEQPGLPLVAGAAALMVVLQSVVGTAQVLRQHSLGLETLGELALDPTWRGVSVVWSGSTLFLRAYGLSDHPNLLGGCLAFALVLMLAVRPVRPRALHTTAFALGTVALLLTFSRTAWLAAAGGMLAIMALEWISGRRARASGMLGLLLGALIVVAPFAWAYAPFLGVRANLAEPSMIGGGNRSIVEREVLNEAALGLIAARPLAGSGLGTAPLALRAARPNFPFDYQPPHNVWLAAAVESGMPGALALAALAVLPWVALAPLVRRRALTPALTAASGLLLAVSLAGLLDYYTWLLPAGRLWQWLAWGLWSGAYAQAKGERHDG